MSSTTQLRGGKRARPLGALRHSSADEKVLIPKLNNFSVKIQNGEKLNENYAGIQGNSMTLPNFKDSTKPEEKQKSATSVKEHSTVAVAESHEACEREIKEALIREKELKNKIAQLEKQLEVLMTQVTSKDEVIFNLTKNVKNMEEDFKKKLDLEQASHAETQELLKSSVAEVQTALNRLETQEKESKEKLDLIHLELSTQMNEMIAIKDKEIADRDQKLNRLKMQMADALKGNSWERQQQLEELTKDLARIQDECDSLRSKLRVLTKNKPQQSQCQNCAEATSRAEKLAMTLKEREVTLKDLKSLCAKFEKQLSQQDQLLKTWADSKGHKVTIPK